jgi:hypothetical protein
MLSGRQQHIPQMESAVDLVEADGSVVHLRQRLQVISLLDGIWAKRVTDKAKLVPGGQTRQDGNR